MQITIRFLKRRGLNIHKGANRLLNRLNMHTYIYFFSIFTSCLLQRTNAKIICIQAIFFKCKFYHIYVVTIAFANQCTYTCRYNEILPIFFFIQIRYRKSPLL